MVNYLCKKAIMKKILIGLIVLALASCSELLHVISEASQVKNPVITDLDIANGLKSALNKGVEKEVKKLTQTNGFLKNEKVKILFPSELQHVEKKLRDIGLGALPEKGLELLNRAAEEAVKEATPIFISAIKNMSFADARNILMGHDSSATKYLESTTRDSLYAKFYPVMDASFSKVGADKAWSGITTNYNAIPFVKKVNTDIKDFVSNCALNGVFKMITKEEKVIRNDLSERTSDLLKRVFSLQDL